MMMKGDALKPEAAQKLNLIHDIAPQSDSVARAKAWNLGWRFAHRAMGSREV